MTCRRVTVVFLFFFSPFRVFFLLYISWILTVLIVAFRRNAPEADSTNLVLTVHPNLLGSWGDEAICRLMATGCFKRHSSSSCEHFNTLIFKILKIFRKYNLKCPILIVVLVILVKMIETKYPYVKFLHISKLIKYMYKLIFIHFFFLVKSANFASFFTFRCNGLKGPKNHSACSGSIRRCRLADLWIRSSGQATLHSKVVPWWCRILSLCTEKKTSWPRITCEKYKSRCKLELQHFIFKI